MLTEKNFLVGVVVGAVLCYIYHHYMKKGGNS